MNNTSIFKYIVPLIFLPETLTGQINILSDKFEKDFGEYYLKQYMHDMSAVMLCIYLG